MRVVSVIPIFYAFHSVLRNETDSRIVVIAIAPIAQWIEYWPSKPRMAVQVRLGAPRFAYEGGFILYMDTILQNDYRLPLWGSRLVDKNMDDDRGAGAETARVAKRNVF